MLLIKIPLVLLIKQLLNIYFFFFQSDEICHLENMNWEFML